MHAEPSLSEHPHIPRSVGWGPVAMAVALEVALVVTWSAGFVGTRFALDYAPLFSILFWRSFLAGALLLPLALFKGPPIRGRDMVEQVCYGVFSMAAYLGCYSLAISYGAPTGVVALITDMVPLMVALLSWPLLRIKLTGRQWLGTVVGMAGVLVASHASIRTGDTPVWAFAFPVLGTAAFAVATLLQRNSPSRGMPVYQQLCIQCLAAAAVFAPIAMAHGGLVPTLHPAFMGGILWLTFVATFGSWGLYYLALRRFSAARVTAVLYVCPPLTMVWAWAMFDEPLTYSMVVGLLISLVGIVVFARAPAAQASAQA